ncbi:aminoglycoside phosphotransferase family protein [Streptomyces acidiscabies]|uniref:Aminoglycoside phosphotransferase domain-containing protein n=1 Tax=Streptomyces acidiscabies TaxID=42234 RepID=A0A0L0KPP8_9ACTN|nr:aminoglycoside phosphotransferase family protein [Streptomyces acidiscabies]KND39821.1 hypothetical protein IQ63_01695 [Streptomyces acidiscabies]
MTGQVPAAVSRACAILLGVPARTAQRLAAGTRTAVYRTGLADGRSVVVKLYAATAHRNAITEGSAFRAVANRVPVPAVLGCGTLPWHGSTALITADLGPITLGSAVRSGQVRDDRALRDLGGLLGSLHRTPVHVSTPRRPFCEQVSSLGRRCPPGTLDRIAPTLAAIADASRTAPVWCHGDVHLDNVVISGPRAVRHLVDFTDTAVGPRESDVAQTLVMTDAIASVRAGTVTDAYPLAFDPRLLSTWAVFHTVRCWAHSSPGDDRALWTGRLNELARRTPHLFHTPRPQRTR